MNDQSQDRPSANETAADRTPPPPSQAPVPPPAYSAHPGTAPARNLWPVTVALVALGIAVAVAGYVWMEQRAGMDQRLVDLRREFSGGSSQLDALGARLDEAAAARKRLADDLERLSERVVRETDQASTVPGRLDQLEERIERFVGMGDKVRVAWLLAEAEHYVRIANAQLGLAGDVDVAQTALGLADDTLRELNDPRLIAVRKLLSEELAALRAVPRPDIEGIVLSLGTLAGTIEMLPLKQTAPAEFHATRNRPADDLVGTERAVAAIGDAFKSLVSIRRTDEPVTPLLPEAEQALLTRSLDLELQLARLAIMRRDVGMYRRSLEAATLRLQRHYDVSSPDVQAALTTLDELGGTELPDELPDISGSLAALERAIPGLTGNAGDAR